HTHTQSAVQFFLHFCAMILTVLGNSSGGPFHGRHYPAHFLQIDNHYFLIDCGEGTQMQLFRYKCKTERLKQIFITHFHGDHLFGLLGLLTNWSLRGRTETLQIFAPPGLQEWLDATFKVCSVRLPYLIELVEVDAHKHQKVFENNSLEVFSIPLNHRIACCGWLFREKEKPRNMLADQIEKYKIPYQAIPAIKNGADYALPDGSLIPNAELTKAPPPPRAYAYCSDTAPSEQIAEWVKGVDLLYHEATFTQEHLEEAQISFHSTAVQAAEIASQASVGQLLLGHFSGRYPDTAQHLLEARAVFPNTFAAEEGLPWLIPYSTKNI
ncbi:MAG: ribonuclease Z, partial [Bacteroidetes bacterium]|nr:ribonuclease Z [Bacteroidota bacterium]